MTYTEAIDILKHIKIVEIQPHENYAINLAIKVLEEKEEEEKIKKAVIKLINKKNTFGDILDDV